MLIFAEETSPSLPMKHLCLLLLLLAVSPAAAISLVEATVYLKNGTTETYRDADRIELPCGGKPLKGLRDAFGKRRKITYRLDEIDSVVCWHPRSPERRHKFRPSTEVGWCWVYLETPHIGVHIYARRGYTIQRRYQPAQSLPMVGPLLDGGGHLPAQNRRHGALCSRRSGAAVAGCVPRTHLPLHRRRPRALRAHPRIRRPAQQDGRPAARLSSLDTLTLKPIRS